MKRILLVDDEQIVVKSLKEGLRKYEKDLFITDIAFNATEAINLLKQKTYNLVVSDIRLPDKSGVDIFWELKKIQPACKFIAITAFSDPEVKKKVEELGALKYLEKPFDFKEFEKLVLKALEEENLSRAEGLTDLIEFTTLLQLINMEKKTLVLWVTLDNKKGYVAFEDGEIVDAKYGDLRGIEAANYLIMKNSGELKIDKDQRSKKRTIDVPFMTLLLNAVKTKDDLNREGKSERVGNFCKCSDISQNDLIVKIKDEFKTIANKFKEIDCLYVFEVKGKYVIDDCFVKKSMNIKGKIYKLWHIVQTFFEEKTKRKVNLFEVFYKKKILLFKQIHLGGKTFVFVVQLNAKINYAMFKQSLEKFFDVLMNH